MNHLLLSLLIVLFLITSCASKQVKTGLDNIAEYAEIFSGNRVGIITNHTGCNQEGKYILDIFRQMPDVKVTALFGPEHGILGNHDAGAQIESGQDSGTQIPVYSLYGPTLKPTPEMLTGVDMIVYDIQDIGARFYTYIWTMALAMEACAEQGKTFVVLDRPNPINGIDVEGPVLEPEFATFVGLYPIPVRHGMTIGELARLFNNEGWLKEGVRADLKVIPLQDWNRQMWYDETGLKFIDPSPNIPNLETAVVYPGMCLWEGTNVSEGRGTYQPFQQFGAPWIDKSTFTNELNALNLPGILFEPVEFTPVSIPGMSSNPKLQDQICYGAKVIVTDRNNLEPFLAAIAVIERTYQLYTDSMTFRESHFDRLCGTAGIRTAILEGEDLNQWHANRQDSLEAFRIIRQKYLIY